MVKESRSFIFDLVEYFDNNGRIPRAMKNRLLSCLSEIEPAEQKTIEEPVVPVKKLKKVAKPLLRSSAELEMDGRTAIVIYVSSQSGSTKIRKRQREVLDFLQSRRIEVM